MSQTQRTPTTNKRTRDEGTSPRRDEGGPSEPRDEGGAPPPPPPPPPPPARTSPYLRKATYTFEQHNQALLEMEEVGVGVAQHAHVVGSILYTLCFCAPPCAQDYEERIKKIKASNRGTVERHKQDLVKLKKEKEKTKELEEALRAARAAKADAEVAQAAAEAREAETKQEVTTLRKSVNDMLAANIAAMATALNTTLYGVAPAPPAAAPPADA